jgi:hypothetical protein
MLRCVLCGADLGEHDGYVRGSISGEVIQPGPKATGQKNSWEGLAFCMQHFEDIPKNIAENLALIAKKRELANNDH